MKAVLEFELPESKEELKIAIRAMDMLGSVRDFAEKLRSIKKYGNEYKNADEAVECICSDYYHAMAEWIA